MKALKIFSLLAVILFQITTYAQSNETPSNPIPQEPSKGEKIAKRLEILSYAIDLYYEQILNVATTLKLDNLKITSPRDNMSPDEAKSLFDLDNTKAEINQAFRDYKAEIDMISLEPDSLKIYENLKFLYDVVLVKAFLPRYDTAKGNFVTRIFTFNMAQYAEELVSRNDALDLFYKDFDLNEPKGVLNSDFRLTSLIKIHNEITAKLNRNREANIFQTYPKRIKAKNGAEESFIYESIVRGETLKPYQAPAVAARRVIAPMILNANKIDVDHFSITPSCSGLFAN